MWKDTVRKKVILRRRFGLLKGSRGMVGLIVLAFSLCFLMAWALLAWWKHYY